MSQKIIAVDVDGVVANIHSPWLERYNRDYDDNLTAKDIKSWGISEYVKVACGEEIYSYLSDPTLYDDVTPVLDALYGVNLLRKMDYRVVFVTDASVHPGQKMRWLQDWGFLSDVKDYYEARDKSLIASDYLIDDRIFNVQNAHGRGIIFAQEWNKYLLGYPRLFDWAFTYHLFGEREFKL